MSSGNNLAYETSSGGLQDSSPVNSSSHSNSWEIQPIPKIGTHIFSDIRHGCHGLVLGGVGAWRRYDMALKESLIKPRINAGLSVKIIEGTISWERRMICQGMWPLWEDKTF